MNGTDGTYSSDGEAERNTVPPCRVLVVMENVYDLLVIRDAQLFGGYFLVETSRSTIATISMVKWKAAYLPKQLSWFPEISNHLR